MKKKGFKYEPIDFEKIDFFFEEDDDESIDKPLKIKGTRVRLEITMDSVTDKKIIDKLNKQKNKAEYIRQLILRDTQ